MKKVALGAQPLVYPMPAFLIGADVDGKANFMTAAWSGIANSNPPMITVALQHHRSTLKGIKQNGAFSINVPSVEQAVETDYCGIISGSKEDKVAVCGFTVFRGKIKSVPMIEQCPVSLECRVVHILNLGSHELVVGQIEEVHMSEECLTNGEPDLAKVNPLIYCTGPDKSYHRMGDRVASAFSVGMEMKKGK